VAKAGDTVENPATGERFKWHQTAADTGGRLVRIEAWVRPGGGASTEHVHRRSEERFELLAGRMSLEVAGRRRMLSAGERGTVPAGVPHRWWNAGSEELHALVEVDPPLRFEQLIETTCRLAREGRVDRRGRPHLLELALTAREFEDEVYVTRPPLWLQRPVFFALAPLARAAAVGFGSPVA
jgi:mannose-6-phosphate isomerase-like protein (cupin superfamily)